MASTGTLLAALASLLHVRGVRQRRDKRALEVTAAIIDALPGGVAAIDPSGYVVAANEEMREFTEGEVDKWLRVGFGGEPHVGGAPVRLFEARDLVDITTVPWVGHDGIRHGTLAFAQRRESFERLASEFVANLSHELRTPMTVIIGYMQTLMRSELSWERAKPRLEAMASAADRLNWIVDMLVLTAQLETKKRVASPTICDVGETLDAAFDELSRTSGGRVQIRAYVRGSILIDWALIEAAMNQLIDNALKFSDGVVDVVVSHLASGGESTLEIAVHDSGIGFDDSAYEALFADFRQGDGSSTRSYGGLGLGLGLVRRIAEVCGVTIEVASAPYCGSTFRLRIPVAVVSEHMPAYT